MSPRWEPDPDVRRGRSVVHNLHVHLVFVTKYRRGVFTAQMLTRCEEVMRAVCRDFGAELREFNGAEDHVHLLVHYPPSVAISRLVNSLKGVSSRAAARGERRADQPGRGARPLLVPVLLRRIVRRGATRDRRELHRRPAETPRLARASSRPKGQVSRSIAAIRELAQAEGVFVGPVYTGKGFAGMLDHVRSGRVAPGSNVAFLHTGDTANLFEIPEVVGQVALCGSQVMSTGLQDDAAKATQPLGVQRPGLPVESDVLVPVVHEEHQGTV